MIRSIVMRDLKGRYVGSLMGFFWAFIHPIALTVIYSLIFSVLFQVKVERMGVAVALPPVPFGLWLLAGILPWTLFAETVSSASHIILSNQQLVTKTLFPSEILPLTTFLTNSINHVIGLFILAVYMVITQTGTDLYLLTLPFYYILLLLFALGLGWIVAALNVYIRDIAQLVQVVIQFWFFATPIIYPAKIVYERGAETVLLAIPGTGIAITPVTLFKLNPFYYIVEGYRNALIANYTGNALPSPLYTVYAVVLCVGVFGVGGFLFKKLKWGFADIL